MIGFARPSRFAALGGWPARLVLLVLAGFIAFGLAHPPAPVPPRTGKVAEDRADVFLYEHIVAGVKAGGEYHAVAARAQRAGHYPVRPFVTMRLPTLAWFEAALPSLAVAALILKALLVAAPALWFLRLRAAGAGPPAAAIGALLVLAGALTFTIPFLVVWHEAWAALLIAISLALRTERKFASALAVGLAALLIREHAVVYVAVMAGTALVQRRWKEAAAWAGAIALFAAYLAWHAARVAAVTLPGDLVSPGWSAAGGWSFVVTMVRLTGPLRVAPHWVATILLPLAMLGWCGWRTPAGLRGAVTLALYLAIFACFGRLDNFYWGFLVAPLVPLGLLFAPAALVDLGRNARLGGPRAALDPA